MLPRREAARQQPQRLLVDLRGAHLQARVPACRLVDDAGGRRVAEVLVLRAHHRGDHLARAGPAIAGEAGDRRVGALDPRRSDEAHACEPEKHLRVGPAKRAILRRHDGDAQALDPPQAHAALLDRVAAERNAVQPPARGAVRVAETVAHGDHPPVAHEVAVVPDGEDEAHEVLPRLHAGERVQQEVAVLVFRVDGAVVPAAARAEVAERVGGQRAVHPGAAQRQRVHPAPLGRVPDTIHDPVGEDALVVLRGAPGMRQRITLRVEPAEPGGPVPRVDRVALGRHREGLGHKGERILEYRAEVQQQRRVGSLRHAVVVFPHPQLEELDTRQVDARGREDLGDGTPAGPVVMRPHPVGGAGA